MLGAYCWLLWLVLVGDWPTFPQFPPDWFKAVARVGYYQAIWPNPWHLKHWRNLGSLLLAVPSCLALVPWLLCPWFLLVVVPVPWPVSVLWSRAVCPRLVQLVWELGVTRSTPCLSIISHGLSVWGYLGHWLGCCPALPWSGWPSIGNLVPQICGTLPKVGGHGSPSPYLFPDFLILAFHLADSNHQLGIWSPRGAVEIPDRIPWKRQSWGVVGPLDLSLSWGTTT